MQIKWNVVGSLQLPAAAIAFLAAAAEAADAAESAAPVAVPSSQSAELKYGITGSMIGSGSSEQYDICLIRTGTLNLATCDKKKQTILCYNFCVITDISIHSDRIQARSGMYFWRPFHAFQLIQWHNPCKKSESLDA